jgi:hypothetical protein
MRVQGGGSPPVSVGDVPGQTGTETPPGPAGAEPSGPGALVGVGVFVLIGTVLFLIAWLSVDHLPYTKQHSRPDVLAGKSWLNAWFRWDGGWYEQIAHRGYFIPLPGQQSPAAYFPAYPYLMRWAGLIFRNRPTGGIFVTALSGATAAGFFAVWLKDRMSPKARWTALLLLLLYPFAFYLYGAVYADALFVAAVLAAFVFLEKDHLWLAGLAGAVATASRPVGAALIVPLVIRLVERRGGIRKVKWKDAGILLTLAGVGAFCLLTWVRYGSPLEFMEAQKGWNQEPGPETWFKLNFFKTLEMFSHTTHDVVAYLSHPILTFAALALVPRVVKRYGWGYGAYVILVVGVTAFSTRNFFGMSRYVLAAFPCFAVAGEMLAERPRLRTGVLAVSAVLLGFGTSLYARGFYLS